MTRRQASLEPGRPTDDDPGGVQAALTELWRELLGEYQPGSEVALGPDTDFFAGAASIVAVMMLGRVYEQFGVDVSFVAFQEDPTIRGLSRCIIDSVLAEPEPFPTQQSHSKS